MNSFSCSICFSSFKTSDEICSTCCGHVFHYRCLQDWFIRGSITCPECRYRVVTIHKLFLNSENNNSTLNAEADQTEHQHDILNCKIKSLEELLDKRTSEINEKKSEIANLKASLDTANSKLDTADILHKFESKMLQEYKSENEKLRNINEHLLSKIQSNFEDQNAPGTSGNHKKVEKIRGLTVESHNNITSFRLSPINNKKATTTPENPVRHNPPRKAKSKQLNYKI